MTFIQNYFTKINLNIPQITFRATNSVSYNEVPESFYNKDSFSTNPLQKHYSDAEKIENTARANPRIIEILSKYNIPLKVNMEELEKLQKGHLAQTRLVAAELYSQLPDEKKKEVNLSNLQQAAMLHDFGKVLIPPEILNKKGTLTPEEREIMELHSELGYELLKEQGLNPEVLRLIKYHHQKSDRTGYPKAEGDFVYDLSSEILETADSYCALREERPYKTSKSKGEAIQTLINDGNDSRVVQALYKINS